jgi:hypothetical protein
VPSHLPIDATSFSHDHEADVAPFRGGWLLVLAVVLTVAACSAAWLVENDKLGQIIDGTINDATAAAGHSA